MSNPISMNERVWHYLSQTQKDLIQEGTYLVNDVIHDGAYHFHDYSFLVFPFAKSYEGFLKQLFKDAGFITHLDYISDHLRLGKLMSPNLIVKLGDRSLYIKVKDCSTKETANRMWQTWKVGRNQIFHYFPHNYKAISFEEAQAIIKEILLTMEHIFEHVQFRFRDKISPPTTISP